MKHQTSSLQLWPANSPDLNPVDYQMWGSSAAGCMTFTSWSDIVLWEPVQRSRDPPSNPVWRQSTALTWSRWGCRRLADNIWLLAHDDNNITSWSHAWSKSGNISTRCSSMKRSSSGVYVFKLAFEYMEDILISDFSNVWYLYRRTLWQSYVCAVAYSGHLFLEVLTKPAITIASVERFT